MSARAGVVPEPTPWSEPFWHGARDSQLLLPWCVECGRPFFYPRPFCPRCLGKNIDWRLATGRGSIYSYTVVRSNPPTAFRSAVPFVIAIVRLDEGVQLLTNVVGDLDALRCDAPVEVVFEPVNVGEFALPKFRVCDSR